MVSSDFRDQLVAAPLKLDDLDPAGRRRYRNFRDQLVAAPLKLSGVAHVDRAPEISATNWSRPH